MQGNRIKEGQRAFEGCGSWNDAKYFRLSRKHYSTLQLDCFLEQIYLLRMVDSNEIMEEFRWFAVHY